MRSTSDVDLPAPACDHASGRCVAEDQLPLRSTWLRIGRQALGDIGLEALFQLCRERQAPVVEQFVVLAGYRCTVRAHVTNHQHLAASVKAVHPPALVALLQAIGMAVAQARGMAQEPTVTVLRLQAAQATPQQARSKAAQPGQLGRRGQVGRGLGMLVGHGHSIENSNSSHVRLIRRKAPANAFYQCIRR